MKVARAINSFGPFKATGPDELKPIVLQISSIGFIKYLTRIYKGVISTGHTPKIWREMGVIFIPKVGKSNYGNAKSYRPITLLSFCLKTLERIIQWYILEHNVRAPLPLQHAYTKGRSCESAISTLVNSI